MNTEKLKKALDHILIDFEERFGIDIEEEGESKDYLKDLYSLIIMQFLD